MKSLADGLVLARENGAYRPRGRFTTELLDLPPRCQFTSIEYTASVPAGAELRMNVLGRSGKRVLEGIASGAGLDIAEPVRLEFLFAASDPSVSPKLDFYQLSFSTDPGLSLGE